MILILIRIFNFLNLFQLPLFLQFFISLCAPRSQATNNLFQKEQ